jgi:hypothetical protein
VTAQRIELTSEGLSLQVDVDDDGRIAVVAISGGGAALRASHYAPALELQYLEAPHSTPVMRLDGSTGAPRLRYREHVTGAEVDTHWLVVTAEDPGRVSALAAAHPDRIGGADQRCGGNQHQR